MAHPVPNLAPDKEDFVLDDVMKLLSIDPEDRTEDQNTALKASLQPFPFFRTLTETQQTGVCRASSLEVVEKEVQLYGGGDTSEIPFRIILSGVVALSIIDGTHAKSVSTFARGSPVGDDLTLQSLPRGASLYAQEQCEFLSLPSLHYERLLKRPLEDAEVTRRVQFFQNLLVPIFFGWGRTDLEKMASRVFIRHYESKKVIVKEREMGECMFFIVSGECKVVREVPFTDGPVPSIKLLELATLVPGEYFGELALLHFIVDGNDRFRVKGRTKEAERRHDRHTRKLRAKARPPEQDSGETKDRWRGKKRVVVKRPEKNFAEPTASSAPKPRVTFGSNMEDQALEEQVPAYPKISPRAPARRAPKPKAPAPTEDDAELSSLSGSSSGEESLEQMTIAQLRQVTDAGSRGVRQSTVFSHTPVDVLVLPSQAFLQTIDTKVLLRLAEYAKGYPTKGEIQQQFVKVRQWQAYKRNLLKDIVTDKKT